jgi:hypothetical protein
MYALKSSGYSFYVSARCVVRSTLVIHTYGWSYSHFIQMVIMSSMMYTEPLSMICEATRLTLRIDKLASEIKNGRQP